MKIKPQILVCLITVRLAYADPSPAPVEPIVLPDVPNNAFCVGEKMNFAIKYEFVTGGTATMEVMEGPLIDGRPTIHIESNARSNGFVDKFFKVRDLNASTVDRASLCSFNFHQNLKEGGYSVIRNTSLNYKERIYKFHRIRRGTASDRTGAIKEPLHDILSAFYYARTLPLKPGDTYTIRVFSDEDVYGLIVNVAPKIQKISVPAGKFQCIRVDPQVVGDGIFKASDSKMQIWLTNDEQKIPVLIRSKVFIGAFDAELVSYQAGNK